MQATASGRARRTDRHDRHDRGYSLIEVVVSVTLMATLIVPILAAVQASIKGSAVNQGAANAETAIVDAADRINRAPQQCDYTIYAQASVETKGWEPERATVAHQYYDKLTDGWKDGGCPGANPTADLVQKVTITIRTPQADVVRTIEVVKSSV